jgi:hypothetical protein
MEILGNIFNTLEQYSWIGAATNFVHLEDSLDVEVGKIGEMIAMDLTLTKVREHF